MKAIQHGTVIRTWTEYRDGEQIEWCETETGYVFIRDPRYLGWGKWIGDEREKRRGGEV